MKTSPIYGTGISGHQVEFTLQDLIVLGGLQIQLKTGVKQLETKNSELNARGMNFSDTINMPSQVLTQCLTVIGKIVGDIQNLDEAYAELFDMEAPGEKEPEHNPER